MAAFMKCTQASPSCRSRTGMSSPMAPRTLWPTWPHRRSFPDSRRHTPNRLGPRVRGASHLRRPRDTPARHRPPGRFPSRRLQPLQTGPCPCSGRRSRLPGLVVCGNGIHLDQVRLHRLLQLVIPNSVGLSRTNTEHTGRNGLTMGVRLIYFILVYAGLSGWGIVCRTVQTVPSTNNSRPS